MNSIANCIIHFYQQDSSNWKLHQTITIIQDHLHTCRKSFVICAKEWEMTFCSAHDTLWRGDYTIWDYTTWDYTTWDHTSYFVNVSCHLRNVPKQSGKKNCKFNNRVIFMNRSGEDRNSCCSRLEVENLAEGWQEHLQPLAEKVTIGDPPPRNAQERLWNMPLICVSNRKTASSCGIGSYTHRSFSRTGGSHYYYSFCRPLCSLRAKWVPFNTLS